MKRRITALLLCAALLTALALQTSVGRAKTVYFTAANDTLLDLSDSTMPFWYSNLLYVPADVFSCGGLNVSVSYNAAKKTLILRDSQFRLICNLSSGMTVDSNGNIYDFTAVERSGTVFLPINATCRIFGLTGVTRTVAQGNLVRIRNSSAALSDDAFLTAAAPMIASRYAEYAAAQESDEPDQETDAEESKDLYLALTVRSAQQMELWLSALSSSTHHVTFFLTEEFLFDRSANCADLVRHALADGHGLGLASSAPNGGDALEELSSGNALLRDIACVKTRIVLVPAQAERAAEAAGYCPADFTLSCEGATELSSAQINQLLSRAGTSACLDLGDSISSASLRTLLARAAGRGYIGRSLREIPA